MADAIVLGAGFGGISAALELRRRLGPKDTVTIVDEGTTFRMGLGNLWLLDGRRKVGEGRRDLAELGAQGIRVKHGRVEAIDAGRRAAKVNGEWLASEGLVIALGARLAPEVTPGFEGVANLYDEDGAADFAAQLQRFKAGRVLIQICGLPFKCPPAPYEAAMIVADEMHRRGVKADIHLATPEPHPLPVAPPEVGGQLLPLLEAANITYHPGKKPLGFADGRVEWEGGTGLDFDLAAAVPVHKAPTVVETSSLAGPQGFIPVDPATLRTKAAGIYAVGDACALPLPNGKMIPKAGILAESQGRVAAGHLSRELQGGDAGPSFDGHGTCFIEIGKGQAIPARGSFFAQPNPSFDFDDASPQGLADKQRFEAERLEAWFS